MSGYNARGRSTAQPSNSSSSRCPQIDQSNPGMTRLHRDNDNNDTCTTTLRRDSSSSPNKTRLRRDTREPNPTSKEEFDEYMQSRQSIIQTLPPEEQEKQHTWAAGKLEETMEGPCSLGFSWVPIKGGYACLGPGHYVPNEFVGSGKFYLVQTRIDGNYLAGPFKRNSETCDWSHPGNRSPRPLSEFPEFESKFNELFEMKVRGLYGPRGQMGGFLQGGYGGQMGMFAPGGYDQGEFHPFGSDMMGGFRY